MSTNDLRKRVEGILDSDTRHDLRGLDVWLETAWAQMNPPIELQEKTENLLIQIAVDKAKK